MGIAKNKKKERVNQKKNIFDHEARVSAPFLKEGPEMISLSAQGRYWKKRKITTCEIDSVSISLTLAPHPHTLSLLLSIHTLSLTLAPHPHSLTLPLTTYILSSSHSHPFALLHYTTQLLPHYVKQWFGYLSLSSISLFVRNLILHLK